MRGIAYRGLSVVAQLPNRVWMLLPFRVRSWWAGEWVRREMEARR